MRYTIAGYAILGSRQSRNSSIAGDGGTVDADRTFAGSPRPVQIDVPVTGIVEAQAYLEAAPSYLVPGVRRFGLFRYSYPGTLQSRQASVNGANGALEVGRTFVGVPRGVHVDAPVVGTMDVLAYLVAPPSYLVPGVRRFDLSRFSCAGTLQSRHTDVGAAGASVDASRTPFIGAERSIAVTGVGGYLVVRSYAVPDVSGPVTVLFEEVYPI